MGPMVAPVHFDSKILPKGSAKLRWVGQRQGTSYLYPLWKNALDVGGPSSIDFIYFWGSDKQSNTMGEGGVARSAPVWGNNKLKKTGARSARARTRGKNPLVC
jgi:hypothetical protein